MVTIENVNVGISRYIDEELSSKVDGLKKWAVSLASVLVTAKITEMYEKHMETLKAVGYVSEDGLIDDSRIISDLKKVAGEKGSVTQQFPYIGTFRFDESDIESLRRYISG